MTPRTLECIECGQPWTWTGGKIRRDVRCPRCRVLQERRDEIAEHLEQLVTDDRGAHLAQIALAAAHRAHAMRPGMAGPGSLTNAIQGVARSGRADERARQNRLVDVATAAVLWAAEINGALDA
jgi:hypothetical protein